MVKQQDVLSGNEPFLLTQEVATQTCLGEHPKPQDSPTSFPSQAHRSKKSWWEPLTND